jgi:type II secretory pathway predicted ATPase ExeA
VSDRTEPQLRAFFGLKALPFLKPPGAEDVLQTPSMTRALERLRYLADRRGIGVIFGGPGTGKSTLLRAFMASLAKTTHAVCYLSHTTCAVLDLYRQIARGFDLSPRYSRADVARELKERIQKLSRQSRIEPVLVIDEAHLLPAPFVEELRLLSSFDADSRDDLTMVLAGHLQLESNLRLAVHEAFSQRIVLRVRLNALDRPEVEKYLLFRLERAGRTAKLFLPDSIEAIAKASHGIPRLIDRLAEHALLLALRDHKKEIDAEIVMQATDEVEP